MGNREGTKRDLILATGNKGKIREIRKHLEGLDINIISLDDLPSTLEVEETGLSYKENALIKAMAAYKASGAMALADDSGLEVDALDGEPGIHSARYGGGGLDDEDRNALLLRELEGVSQKERAARFVCVAVLVDQEGHTVDFSGRLEGFIGLEARGEEGFGYDPIFYLHDSHKSLAQLGVEAKNRISHRAQTMQQVRSYLQRLFVKG